MTREPQTATVEVLTAEVRVLMVGNRQVTLSVARQLDEVPLNDIEPFGRVRLESNGHGPCDWVLGRHLETGALVRSQYRNHLGIPTISDLSGKITVCRQVSWSRDGILTEYGNRKIKLLYGTYEGCKIEEHRYPDRKGCDRWYANGLNDEIEAQIAQHDQKVLLHNKASQLPLIVLAGLK